MFTADELLSFSAGEGWLFLQHHGLHGVGLSFSHVHFLCRQ